jgi:hypothetical protein
MLFSIGDYLAGMAVGAATALTVRMVVWPGMDMVIAMIMGMTLGMLIHIVLGLVMAPLIGMFQCDDAGFAYRHVWRDVVRDARLHGCWLSHAAGGNCSWGKIRRDCGRRG